MCRSSGGGSGRGDGTRAEALRWDVLGRWLQEETARVAGWNQPPGLGTEPRPPSLPLTPELGSLRRGMHVDQMSPDGEGALEACTNRIGHEEPRLEVGARVVESWP